MTENPLPSLGDLSKPATVLVEKISDAVGGIFKPYQIVRVAKAEAQADRVRVESQIEISDIQRRAFRRFLDEEGKKQKNIEDITGKALPQLEENSKPDEVENDWITNFFDKCRLISDDEMQGLWSIVSWRGQFTTNLFHENFKFPFCSRHTRAGPFYSSVWVRLDGRQ